MQASREEVARSLEGTWRDDLLFELRQAVNSYQYCHRQMEECDRELERYLASLPDRILDLPGVQRTAGEHRKANRREP